MGTGRRPAVKRLTTAHHDRPVASTPRVGEQSEQSIDLVEWLTGTATAPVTWNGNAVVMCSGGRASALITCDVDNIGSRRVIENNGGILEDQRGAKLRYWVPTRSGWAPLS